MFDKAKSWGDVGNNLKKLRNHLETAPPPCLPYIGIFLHDMIYIDEVYPKQVNGKINWAYASDPPSSHTKQKTSRTSEDINEDPFFSL